MIFLVALIILSTVSEAHRPEAELSGGAVALGTRTRSGGAQFLGIAYGEIPGRFQHSLQTWPYAKGSRVEANEGGPSCMQSDLVSFENETMSEDCLFLNVWVPPKTSKKSKLPVMFWIHGGSFTSGSGTPVGKDGVGIFNGEKLAASQNVIVVTINYRLGPFGFLVLEDGTGGMNGIRDQMLALRWVKDNIAGFGGDRNQVTIFGESAGGCATCLLAIAPAAKDLFKRAIVQSGPCVGPWGPNSVQFGNQNREALKAKLNASSLASVPAKSLAKLGWPLPSQGYFYDKSVIKHNTSYYFQRGLVHTNEFIIGDNSFDGTSELFPLFPKTEADLKAALLASYNATTEAAVMSRYDPSRFNGSVAAAFVMQNGDNAVTCPSIQIADMLSGAGKRVYMYYYAHYFQCVDLAGVLGKVPPLFHGWASHASEIPALFGNFGFKDPLNKAWKHCAVSDGDCNDRISTLLQLLWGDVAHGVDGRAKLWKAYSSSNEKLVNIQDDGVAVSTTWGELRKRGDCAVLPSLDPL